MKNKLYIFGIICVLLILTGAMFKIQHWPGAGILLTLGLSSFSLVFIPTALINSYRTETDKKLKRLYIIAYVCILIDCIGVLFKIQHWPGAGFFLIVSIPMPFVLFLPAYLLQIRKNKQLNYNNLLLVLFFFAYFAAITALLSLNVSKDILDEFVDSANHYEQQTQITTLQTSAIIESVPAKDSVKKEALLKIKTQSASLYRIIDRIKTDVIITVDDQNQQAIDADGKITLSEIIGKDNRNIYLREKFKTESVELKKGIAAYRNLLLTAYDTKEVEVTEFLNRILSTPDEWEFNQFDGKTMIAIIEALCSVKNSIALAELETVSTIADRAN